MQADSVRRSVDAETTVERDLKHWGMVAPALEPVFANVWAARSRGGQSFLGVAPHGCNLVLGKVHAESLVLGTGR